MEIEELNGDEISSMVNEIGKTFYEKFQELIVDAFGMFADDPKQAIGDPYDWWVEHHQHPKVRCHIPRIINIVPKIRQKIIKSWHCVPEEIIKGDE
ncbi:hypothetical protein [Megasphaera sueciensis]|uniref:hypothetical protein n=1 Tax=Megasphaera sueciensis TaxID=349094 RepID=UPI003CFE5417